MAPSSLTDALRETLALFEADGEPHTTTEVAESLDLGRRSTYERLARLVEQDRLETKKVGANARVWWLPAERDQRTDSHDRGRRPDESSHRFRALVDAVEEYAIFMLDPDGTVRTWNAGAEQIKGYAADDIVGRHFSTFYTEADREAGVPDTNLRAAADEGATEDEGWRIREDGSRFWANVTITAIYDDTGDVQGFAKVTRDMTERREYERRLEDQAEQLERQRDVLEAELDEVFERIDDAFYAVDDEFRFTYVNERAEELLQHDEAELLGESVWEMFPDATETLVWERFHTALESQEPTSFDLYYAPLEFWVEANVYPSESGLSVYFRDITERKERERELEESRRRYETLLENFPNGAVTLVDADLRFLSVGGEIMEPADTTIDQLEGSHLREELPEDLIDVVGPRYEAALEGEASTLEREISDRVYRFHIVPVRDDDGDVFAAMGMSQDITDQKDRERELERRREQLAALNNLNEVVREITDAVIEQSTRREIETAVCDRLAVVDSYEFAWVAEVDAQTDAITPRVEVGADGFLEDIDLSPAPDDPAGQGPAGTAVRTREMQVSADVFEDQDFEAWRESAETYGFRSFAAIPITYEETLYGLLGVHADRANAFGPEERRVIGNLGDVVGHAIAAIGRKQALMSEEVTEIEFRVPSFLGTLGLEDGPEAEGTVTIDHIVALGDDEFLGYGSVHQGAIETLEAVVAAYPDFSALTIFDRSVDPARFEFRGVDPPLVSAVTAHGGYVQEARFEDDSLDVRVHLPPSASVREVVDVVETAYPSVTLLRRREVTRDETNATMHQTVTESLTERQRAALETALFSGFFEWPRASTGEELAESLGVTAPTFHQHLRKAQRKTFEALLSPGTRSDGETD